MAHMHDHAAGLRFVGALALTVAILTELAAEGVVTLIGIAALGAVLAAWTVVYSAWLCAGSAVVPRRLVKRMLAGAVLMPAVAPLQLVFGMQFWALVIVAGMAWAVSVTVRAH